MPQKQNIAEADRVFCEMVLLRFWLFTIWIWMSFFFLCFSLWTALASFIWCGLFLLARLPVVSAGGKRCSHCSCASQEERRVSINNLRFSLLKSHDPTIQLNGQPLTQIRIVVLCHSSQGLTTRSTFPSRRAQSGVLLP